MKTRYLIFSILLLCLNSSCGRIWLNVVTKNSIDSQVKILENQEESRIIAFLPMIHLGKPSYYKSTKTLIDSLREEHFVVFYEGVGMDPSLDSASIDTINRKFRKLIGFHLGKSYKDSTNKSLPRAMTDNNYIMQDYEMMGVLETDYHVDLSKDEIIRRHEKNVKPISLLPCDFETPLKSKYKCKDPIKYSSFYALQTVRNKHIVKEVLDSEEKKIVMIYGKSHWKFIWPGLRDEGFEITRGKMFNSIFF